MVMMLITTKSRGHVAVGLSPITEPFFTENVTRLFIKKIPCVLMSNRKVNIRNSVGSEKGADSSLNRNAGVVRI